MFLRYIFLLFLLALILFVSWAFYEMNNLSFSQVSRHFIFSKTEEADGIVEKSKIKKSNSAKHYSISYLIEYSYKVAKEGEQFNQKEFSVFKDKQEFESFVDFLAVKKANNLKVLYNSKDPTQNFIKGHSQPFWDIYNYALFISLVVGIIFYVFKYFYRENKFGIAFLKRNEKFQIATIVFLFLLPYSIQPIYLYIQYRVSTEELEGVITSSEEIFRDKYNKNISIKYKFNEVEESLTVPSINKYRNYKILGGEVDLIKIKNEDAYITKHEFDYQNNFIKDTWVFYSWFFIFYYIYLYTKRKAKISKGDGEIASISKFLFNQNINYTYKCSGYNETRYITTAIFNNRHPFIIGQKIPLWWYSNDDYNRCVDYEAMFSDQNQVD